MQPTQPCYDHTASSFAGKDISMAKQIRRKDSAGAVLQKGARILFSTKSVCWIQDGNSAIRIGVSFIATVSLSGL